MYFLTRLFCSFAQLVTDTKPKRQIWRFSTLSLSIQDRDLMWNPTVFFFNVLCVSRTQLQNLLLSFLLKNNKLFTPRLPLALQAFWEEFQALVNQKPLVTENYTILNKRNVPMWRITTLETRQVQFVCVILSWVSLDCLFCIRWGQGQNEPSRISLFKTTS